MALEGHYIQRVVKALDFVDQHLDQPLSLEKVAQEASFSPYHFHRIFKVITGESVHAYIVRLRLEKAALALMLDKPFSIEEIALQTGFSDGASFSKAFKKKYEVSPGSFRKASPGIEGKLVHDKSKNGQVQSSFERYLWNMEELKNWFNENVKVELENVEPLSAAYLDVLGVSALGPAFGRLMHWAGKKGMVDEPNFRMATVFYDSFKVTPHEQVRMRACAILETVEEPSAGIEMMAIEAGKCIVGRCEIRPEDFEKAWTGMFLWMNESGLSKADISPFEVYHNDFNVHPEKKCIVDLHVPVV